MNNAWLGGHLTVLTHDVEAGKEPPEAECLKTI